MKIIFNFIAFIIAFFIGFYFGNCNYNTYKENVILYDTIYNNIILDSIEHNIIKKDSIIYKLNTKMKYEINKSYIINDSGAIELFKKLVAE